jgi:hypothetical protein
VQTGELIMTDSYKIYRARKDHKGSAAQFQYSLKIKKVKDKEFNNPVLFLTLAPQAEDNANGDATFAWQDKKQAVTVTLGENDVADFLAVLANRKAGLGYMKDGKWSGAYHSNPKGNAVIHFGLAEKTGGFNLSVSVKTANANPRVSIQISAGESLILEHLLKDFISAKFGWK